MVALAVVALAVEGVVLLCRMKRCVHSKQRAILKCANEGVGGENNSNCVGPTSCPPPLPPPRPRRCIDSVHPEYTTLKVTRPSDFVLEVQMNRPDRSNAMNRAFWSEIRECFQRVDDDSDTRVVILSGAGKNFTGGE